MNRSATRKVLHRTLGADRVLDPHRRRLYEQPANRAPLMSTASGALVYQRTNLSDAFTTQLAAWRAGRMEIAWMLADALSSYLRRVPAHFTDRVYGLGIEAAATDGSASAQGCLRLAWAHWHLHWDQMSMAEALADSAKELFTDADDRCGLADVRCFQARTHLLLGNPVEARRGYTDARQIYGDLGHDFRVLHTTQGIGRALLAQGTLDAALEVLGDLPAAFNQLAPVDELAVSRALIYSAEALLHYGEPMEAYAELERALPHLDKAGAPRQVAQMKALRADIHLQLGNPDYADFDRKAAHTGYLAVGDHPSANELRAVMAEAMTV